MHLCPMCIHIKRPTLLCFVECILHATLITDDMSRLAANMCIAPSPLWPAGSVDIEDSYAKVDTV